MVCHSVVKVEGGRVGASNETGLWAPYLENVILMDVVPSRSVTNLQSLLSSLSVIQSREAALSESLTEVLSNRDQIFATLTRIHELEPRISILCDEGDILAYHIATTAHTAERIGGQVRSLDEEMRRVKEAGDRVALVTELKVRSLL